MGYSQAVERAKVSGVHVATFVSVAMGFFIWGMLSTLSPISTVFSGLVPKDMYVASLAIPPLFALLGNFVIGHVADSRGRKLSFMLTMASYAVGVAVFLFSFNLVSLLIALFLTQFGVGGEEPPLLALLSENMPVKIRDVVLAIMPNFANVGAAIAAWLEIATSYSFEASKEVIGITITVVIAILVIARLMMPESVRWLEIKGKVNEAEKEASRFKQGNVSVEPATPTASVWFRFLFLALIGLSQFLTFGLMAYTIGPIEFPSLTSYILLDANIGAAVAGIIGAYLVNRISRKAYSVMSFAGGLATIFLIMAFGLGGGLLIFYVLLFLNMAFSELAWVARTVLEPELFPTGKRATLISLIRVLCYGSYSASIFLTISWGVYQYLLFNVALWAVGFAGAVSWFVKGFETRGRSLIPLDS